MPCAHTAVVHHGASHAAAAHTHVALAAGRPHACRRQARRRRRPLLPATPTLPRLRARGRVPRLRRPRADRTAEQPLQVAAHGHRDGHAAHGERHRMRYDGRAAHAVRIGQDRRGEGRAERDAPDAVGGARRARDGPRGRLLQARDRAGRHEHVHGAQRRGAGAAAAAARRAARAATRAGVPARAGPLAAVDAHRRGMASPQRFPVRRSSHRAHDGEGTIYGLTHAREPRQRAADGPRVARKRRSKLAR